MRHCLILAMTAAVSVATAGLAQDQGQPAPQDPPETQAAPAAQPETIISHGVAVYGEPSLPADFAHLPYVNPDAPKGGEISQWFSGGFDNFNPYTIQGRAAILSSIAHETLMTGTADTVGEAYCLLCETIEYPPSKDWVIFTLREGITFSDGSPLTTEDVLFSSDTFRDKGLSSYRTVVAQQIDSVEVLDDRRIRFNFKPDYPRRTIIQEAGSLPVLSRAQFERDGISLDRASNTPLIGSGPYMFGATRDGRSITWQRNPDYWGKDLPINIGRNNFDRIRIEYYADYQSAFEGFKAGSYTFRNEASSLIWSTGYDFPAIRRGHVVKQTLHDGDVATGQIFAINLRRDKFSDIRVREAIGLMFNFEWSNDTLFYGLYQRVNSVWENSYLAAQGLPTAAERAVLEPLAADLPAGVLDEPAVMAPTSGKRQLDRSNLRRAASLLDAAGWIERPAPPHPRAGILPTIGLVALILAFAGIAALRHSGRRRWASSGALILLAVTAGLFMRMQVQPAPDGMRRNEAGQPLTVEILNDSQTFDRVLNPYVENLRVLGVDAMMTRVDDALYENRRRSHDYDMITTQLRPDLLPGSALHQFFGSDSVGDVFNAMGLANPAIDRLIRMVEQSTTEEELTTRVHALDRALRSLRFMVPQWYKGDHTVAFYDIYDHPDTLPPYALGELDFWWYDADKAQKLKEAGALR